MSRISKEQKELMLKRAQYRIKDLLPNIHEEEPDAQEALPEIIKSTPIDFTKPFVVTSISQIYKTYSSIGLLKISNKFLNYKVIDIGILLSVWYNSISDFISKTDILNCDVLIIKGELSNLSFSTSHKLQAMLEIVNVRKGYNRLTWIYFTGDNDSLSNKITKQLSSCCTINKIKY